MLKVAKLIKNTVWCCSNCGAIIDLGSVPTKMGRPTVITPQIAKTIEANPKMPSRKLVETIEKKTGVRIGANSVCNYRTKRHLPQPKPHSKK